KDDLMTTIGRAVLVQRGFLWRCRKNGKGGHCLVAWEKVTRPKELGGLGILDLQCLNWWILGKRLQDLSPHLLRSVSKRIINKRTLTEALEFLLILEQLDGIILVVRL
ncbi:hypothetical protein ACJX0J_007305, partial [Zea mays]